MMGPLLPQVTAKLPWLFQELGFTIVRHNYDYKLFGNSLVELRSDAIRLRFVRDMGKIFADVAPPTLSEDWLGLSWVLEAITGERAETFTGDWELESVASLVRENFGALAEAVGLKLPETKRELQRRYELRKRAPVQRPALRTRIMLTKWRVRRFLFPMALILAVVIGVWITLR